MGRELQSCPASGVRVAIQGVSSREYNGDRYFLQDLDPEERFGNQKQQRMLAFIFLKEIPYLHLNVR